MRKSTGAPPSNTSTPDAPISSPALAAAARLSDFSLTGEERADAVADLKAAVADEEAGR